MTDATTQSTDDSSVVEYIERTRLFYEAQGFEASYQYAKHETTPFTKLNMPLSQTRVGLITTASTYEREDLEPRKVAEGATDQIPDRLYTDDLSWDKEATHTNDVNSYCPITMLQQMEKDGTIGALSARFICAPTEYSQRATREQDAPKILKMLQQDEVDVALLVPL